MAFHKVRSKTGCLTCRQRHLKCDEVRPTCWRCKIGQRECILPPDAVEGSRPPAKRRATFVDHDQGAVYVDSRTQLPATIEPLSQHVSVASPTSPPIPNAISQSPHDIPSIDSPGYHVASHSPNSLIPAGSPPISLATSSPPGSILSVNDGISRTQTLQGILLRLEYGDTRPATPVGTPIEPQPAFLSTTQQEEYLLQHYVLHIGRWFTMSNGSRHFTLLVPRLARGHPILLKAICAASARHLTGLQQCDPAIADEFHEQCIRLLIPALSDPDIAADDPILAALVILRIYEQLTVTETGLDQERHLYGTAALVRSAMRNNKISARNHGLQQAAFWGYFRQCLYVACVNRQPIQFDINNYEIEMTLYTPSIGELATVEEESAWCNWITWILAEVVEFCFGEKSKHMGEKEKIKVWEALRAKVTTWDENRPGSFAPIAVEESDRSKGRVFPSYWYGDDWHALAHMYSLTAHVLLVVHDPSMCNISLKEFGFLRARKQMQDKVVIHARAICGICLANPLNMPTVATLCHTLFAFSSFLTDIEERRLLLEILRRSERDSAWPTAWIVNALKHDWDWVEPI